MSLARLALRLCTVRALRGATMLGQRVMDSEQGPIEDYVENKSEPEILVYTDDCTTALTEPRRLLTGGKQDLVIEIACTQRMKVRLPDQDGEADALVPIETDSKMEAIIDGVGNQIGNALHHATRPWAEMWRSFALNATQKQDRRGSSMRDGVRFAGRQIVLSVDLPHEPMPGVPPGPLWTKFLALVDETPDLAPIAPMLHALIEGTPAELPDWQVMRAGYGMTLDEARAMQLAPLPAAEATSPDFEAMTPDTHPVAPGALP